ncbi:polyprenyl synthetase family protein [Rhizobium halophilum]|uniref:polyprenyl synthetase family protein n=1 Tax=Rhizobium halophilum TaxID=2846852 RepID=UPI001EFD0B54|nr:polyprenyl synthetase family protein [Rhizobium halophilum]MCF6370341.1 polyprenyl synthetase family protein [Rhizobium halophilum]
MQKNSPQDSLRLTLADLKARIDDRLQVLLESGGYAPPNLIAAMRHALLGGGKRFRPLLFVLTVRRRDQLQASIDIGCAIEMVHTASLILDDLPCMDDADLRRDKPTTHRAFGQATAILAAISLLTRGMNIIAAVDNVHGDIRARLVAILSEAVGQTGLAAGQEVDLRGIPHQLMHVEQKNWLKTGKLFAAMAEMASVLDDRSDEQAEALGELAFHVGSAFQALDDLLDATAVSSLLGKDIGKDLGKSSMVNDRGEAATRRSYMFHFDAANAAVSRCGVEEEALRLLLGSIHQLALRQTSAA